MAVERFDAANTWSTVTRTPTGGIRVDARMTRVGVLPYKREDGTIQRELRHPDDVFDPASLATLKDAAVTIGHPDEMVTPETWAAYSVGHVGDPRSEGPYVAGPLAVNAAHAVQGIARDDSDPEALRECSSGYRCDIEGPPGEYNGELYDYRQRNIAYNHLALLPKGAGRAGPNVRLRLDAAACIVESHMATETQTQPRNTRVHRIDGIDYEAGTEAHVQAADRRIGALSAELATAQASLATAKKDAADALAKSSPQAIAKAVETRADLLATARKVIGPTYGKRKDADGADAPPAGDDDSIIRDILTKAIPGLDVGSMSHEALMGALSAWAAGSMADESSETETEVPPPMDGVSAPAFDAKHIPRAAPTKGPTKSSEPSSYEKARTDAAEKSRARWQKTLEPRNGAR
jgi:hypothetical protein